MAKDDDDFAKDIKDDFQAARDSMETDYDNFVKEINGEFGSFTKKGRSDFKKFTSEAKKDLHEVMKKEREASGLDGIGGVKLHKVSLKDAPETGSAVLLQDAKMTLATQYGFDVASMTTKKTEDGKTVFCSENGVAILKPDSSLFISQPGDMGGNLIETKVTPRGAGNQVLVARKNVFPDAAHHEDIKLMRDTYAEAGFNNQSVKNSLNAQYNVSKTAYDKEHGNAPAVATYSPAQKPGQEL